MPEDWEVSQQVIKGQTQLKSMHALLGTGLGSSTQEQARKHDA